MKKEAFSIRRREIILGSILVTSLSSALFNSDTAGKSKTEAESYPQEIFSPVIINYNEQNYPQPIPSREPAIELNKPLSKEDKIKQELNQVIEIMSAYPDTFKQKYIEDVKMYYPIYKAVAKDLWYLAFIVHEQETGASAGENGFSTNSYYKGAMQRDPNIWTEDFVNKAAEGLEYLKDLPQRRKDDWKEIAAGFAILNRNITLYKNQGIDKAVQNALLLYSAEEPAEKRFALFKEYKEIFTQKTEFEIYLADKAF